MQNIIMILGKTKLSEFRLNKLRSSLEDTSLLATELYLITAYNSLDTAQINNLELLLNGQQIKNITIDKKNIIVSPRFGTVSPWSSKATEIAHRCLITQVQRIEKVLYYQANTDLSIIHDIIHDKMTESIITNPSDIANIFINQDGSSYQEIDILNLGKKAIAEANIKMGLALSDDEIDYLYQNYLTLNKNISDVELMMFAQANSEHCRHKIFNAKFIINQQEQSKSLFQMIKDTYHNAPYNILVAYDDNSSVIKGYSIQHFAPSFEDKTYRFTTQDMHILMKVETHNHPTAIEPFAGAATGSGGEIRDEGATGIGSKPKAGLCGFSVSYLNIANTDQISNYGKPNHIKSALEIITHGPIGASSFNNEFGRPNLCGYFRSFEQDVNGIHYGYHKPIMLAGGYGNIKEPHIKKLEVTPDALIIQLGGPGFLIGLGGGSASSMTSGDNTLNLDFNSVQRSNPEIERRVQEVIDSCCSLDLHNPILSIHDVGAGGLSNAVPELVHGSGMGGKFELRQIPIYDNSMNPLEIWCNESQERYVLAIKPQSFEMFSKICQRENCHFSMLGHATKDKLLILHDNKFNNNPIHMQIDILLGKPPKTIKDVKYQKQYILDNLEYNKLNTKDNLYKVLKHPTVANKSFLITIGDRSVGGHTVRDQMIGKWQIPVADCAITALGYQSIEGEVMAIGEKTPLAILDPAASGRMAIAESITNILSAKINNINDIKLSANWMASCGSENEDANLYHTVNAVSELCQKLNLAIPVGKDSLSMKMKWDKNKQVMSPISLIVSAFAPTDNVNSHLTPELKPKPNTSIILITLNNQMRMGGSILQECNNNIAGITPDVDNAQHLIHLFEIIKQYRQDILSYHDRSDGGLVASLCEMIFCSRIGITLKLAHNNLNQFLFNEEIGVILQIDNVKLNQLIQDVVHYNLSLTNLGTINLDNDNLVIYNNNQLIINEKREDLQTVWSTISNHIQTIRDNPECAKSELDTLKANNTGLFIDFNFDKNSFALPTIIKKIRPKVAILREQGINGHLEMAASFTLAGFDAVDVHMNDLISNRFNLKDFVGLVACGGFSYGDVLGAGLGWANSILFNPFLKEQFSNFFKRKNTFTLGVCNGCQMIAHLKDIIPGAKNFPKFTKNISEQFEARVVMVEITESPSIFFKDMIGSYLPIIVSHGEGYANFDQQIPQVQVGLRYVDSNRQVTEKYPFNPNGSIAGITGICSDDGRVTIMMPHPERTFRTQQMSYRGNLDTEMSPWFKMFLNAYKFVDI